jgi:hypothetical protein
MTLIVLEQLGTGARWPLMLKFVPTAPASYRPRSPADRPGDRTAGDCIRIYIGVERYIEVEDGSVDIQLKTRRGSGGGYDRWGADRSKIAVDIWQYPHWRLLSV